MERYLRRTGQTGEESERLHSEEIVVLTGIANESYRGYHVRPTQENIHP